MWRNQIRWDACSAVIALVVATGAPSANAQRFQKLFDSPWIGYNAAYYPDAASYSSRSADFNGDGVPDLAVNGWDNQNGVLSVLIGDGQGGYFPPDRYEMFLLPGSDVEVADFDNDGDIDIAAINTGIQWSGYIFTLFLNNGGGGFAPAGQFELSTPLDAPSSATVADFNGDGWMDLAVAHERYIESANSMAYLLNDGRGGFHPFRNIELDWRGSTSGITSGDIDGDGDPDVIVGMKNGGFQVVRNTAGSLSPGAAYLDVGGPWVRLVDLDRDGDLDLATAGGGGAMYIFRNDGAGGFGAPESYLLPRGAFGGGAVHAADIDVDGWPDLFVTSYPNYNWALFRNDGAGGLRACEPYNAGGNASSIQTGDLDGDDDLDLTVLASDSLEACVYINPGDGRFIQPTAINLHDPRMAPTPHSNLGRGDIDGDGDIDLAIGYSANFGEEAGIAISRNNGDGSFAAGERYLINGLLNYGVWTVRLYDMNGDGALDLLYAQESVFSIKIMSRHNLGDGTFSETPITHFSDSCDVVDAYDVNVDGHLDIVLGGCYGSINIALNNGDGTMQPRRSHRVGGNTHAFAFGDFDSDGLPDLLTGSGIQGDLEISLGNGDGTFRSPQPVSAWRATAAIGVADFDLDGAADFASVGNLDGVGMTVRRGRGNGDFFLPHNQRGSNSYIWDQVRSIQVGDADRDGFADVLTANYGAQEISYWRGRGDGTFDEQVRYGVGHRALDLSFSDFDGDSVNDLGVLVEATSRFNDWEYPAFVLVKGITGGGGGNLLLDASGSCPGAMTLTASGATPNGTVAFIYATGRGSVRVPGGACAGIEFGLNATATLLQTVRADGSGIASMIGNAPASACGRVVVQALDLSECETSNVEEL